MKIVFDENVPWPLRQFFTEHEITSVQREGHGGIENGELLARLEGHFDIFILADKNLRYQQNLKDSSISCQTKSASVARQNNVVTDLIELIAEDQVPDRPFPREPRAVKRRPKPHQLLIKPRHEMVEISHGSRYIKAKQEIIAIET